MALPALGPALPEIILALGAIAMVLVGAIRGERATRLLEGVALALFALTLVLVLSGTGKVTTFNDGFIVDSFARFFKVLTLLGAAAAILLSADSLRRDGSMRFEFPILIVLATVGMMMMISANDLISLYVGLELQSLALYVVAAFDRDNTKSTEAGLKYFVLGALSSGMLLYGASLTYGFTGTVTYPGIAAAVQHGHPGHRAGRAHGQRASGAQAGYYVALLVEVHVAGSASGGGFAEVEAAGRAVAVVVEQEAAAAHVARHGQHHGQGKLHGHSRIIGITAPLQNQGANFRGFGVGRNHHGVVGQARRGRFGHR